MSHDERAELREYLPAERVRDVVKTARSQWTGCDWNTEFGPRKLNLCGLTSRHANLLATATAGEEAQAWRDAELWLRRVEADAHEAQAAAANVEKHAFDNNWIAAEREADRAVRIESNYPRQSTWQNLLDLIRTVRVRE